MVIDKTIMSKNITSHTVSSKLFVHIFVIECKSIYDVSMIPFTSTSENLKWCKLNCHYKVFSLIE